MQRSKAPFELVKVLRKKTFMKEIDGKIIIEQDEFKRSGQRRLLFYTILVIVAFGVGYYCGSVFEGHKHYQRGYKKAVKDIEPYIEQPHSTSTHEKPAIL